MEQTRHLYHHGIKGQRWGVRNGPPYPLDASQRTTARKKTLDDTPIIFRKKGESVELHQESVSSMAKFLGKFIPSVAENNRNYRDYKIKSKDGKTIGTATTNRVSDKEINLVWISINEGNSGKGNGQSAMRTILEQARKERYKYVTLEVPTTSPNARHIYEKLGFKPTGEKIGDEDDVWGGLTKMRLEL